MNQEICVRPPSNISAAGQRFRFFMGLGALVVAALVAWVTRGPQTHVVWRLAMGLPLFFGLMGLLQAREKT